MRHLTAADYTEMPWKNGKGTTVEMIRVNAPDGSLLWRLSMAMVTEDGPFSAFPGVERNLTVIDGPGFDLTGDVTLRADPLIPVAFRGDVVVSAAGVTGPSRDFNVMTARALPRPVVRVLTGGVAEGLVAGRLCLFALEPAAVNGRAMARHDLVILQDEARLSGGSFIAVALDV